MKPNLLASLLGATALLAPLHALGAGINATYHPIAGNQWAADFVVTGDGTPAVINDFTIYFPDTTFASLSLATNATGWDSIVAQPDTTLHSPGFLDSLALGAGIGNGASLSGIEVKFSYLGGGSPGALRFDINDANFHAVYSGLTTVSAVPEPETAWLLLVGLGAFAARRKRQQHRQRPARSAA